MPRRKGRQPSCFPASLKNSRPLSDASHLGYLSILPPGGSFSAHVSPQLSWASPCPPILYTDPWFPQGCTRSPDPHLARAPPVPRPHPGVGCGLRPGPGWLWSGSLMPLFCPRPRGSGEGEGASLLSSFFTSQRRMDPPARTFPPTLHCPPVLPSSSCSPSQPTVPYLG